MNGMKVYERVGEFCFVKYCKNIILFIKYMYLNVVCFTDYKAV